ncbi:MULTISPECIES: hypothetical protein [Nostoc]|uniref:Uncharacterized protein n=1 Tax=Nostoc paludosum FACHB-159 TaxID=2692908 RepID=A0ABR8KHC3_9NOSO|nr:MULTISPECIES: hypothetical protein [Nostoc]MBD2680998.1 hypothetical protein [Nostoc sp. FACHB-857]MBD2737457.1 hypothetical protein [Nostoc paludosum FACHB-159]
MQIIKPLLTNNTHPLGVISSLSNTHKLIFRKESDFLHSRSNFLSPIQTKSPLVTSSQFVLSREAEPSIQPVIGWDSWDNPDIDLKFPFIDFDPFEPIDSEEDNNLNSPEIVTTDIPEIQRTIIENNIINDASPEINLQKQKQSQTKNKSQTKSKSKQTNKSAQNPKTKSPNKKSTKSSAAKNVVQAVDESNIAINPNQDVFIPSKDYLFPEANSGISQTNNEFHVLKSQIPDPLFASTPLSENNPLTSQQDTALDNITIDNNSVNNTTPSTWSNVQEQPNLFRNIANEESQVFSELPSSFSSAEPSTSERIPPLQQKNKLGENTNQLPDNSPREFPLPNHVEKTFSPSNNITNNQQLVAETSEVNPTPRQQNIETTQSSQKFEVDIPDISVSTTPQQQVIETTQLSQKANIPDISVSPTPQQQVIETTQLSQKADIPDISVSPTPQQQVIETTQLSQKADIPDISVSTTPQQQVIETDELSSKVQKKDTSSLRNVIPKQEILVKSNHQSNQQELLNTSNNLESIPAIEQDLISENYITNFDSSNFIIDDSVITSSSVENPAVTDSSANLPPVSDVKKNPIALEREIDSSVTSESLASAPIQLTPTSAYIEATSNFLSDFDSNEKLATSESQSTVAVNVSDVPKNLISLQRDNNLENPSSESIESQLSLAVHEISETPVVSNVSPEIGETQKVSNESSKINESPIVNNISPEIGETQKVSNVLPEIDETPIVNNVSPEIGETQKVSNVLPEIDETPIVSNVSPEIGETQKVSNVLPEIDETPIVSNVSPEIIESPKINNISPEIDEVPKVRDVSSNVGETSSIFRKIGDNEQILESELLGAIANSENSEIDTSEYQDIPEKPTFPPNQLSTPPQFEQNTTIENLPAPKGYATGGQVRDSHLENNQHIAPSDTVPAMLTPGEFVINTRDAQKNLPLLQHINSGGTPDNIILPSLEIPNAKESQKTTSPHSTKVDSFTDTSLQLKPQESNSLIPSSLGFNVGKQKLSVLNSPQLNTVENKTTDSPVTSPQYSSPPLIFRKANSTANTPSQWSDTPSQWSNVQELFNGNNDEDEFTSFFSGGKSNSQNSEFSDVYPSSESSQSFAKHRAAPRGFAEGGEVTAPASVNTESLSETVESTSAKREEENKDDTADLEALAREIYSRLRQRLEIERERHGGYLGRLSW